MEKIVLNRALISLGSNLGDKSAYLKQAIDSIQDLIGDVEFISSFHESAPWGYDSENQFLNACITCYTHLSPFELLDQLKQIELSMGRIKTVNGYEDRCIDLDIVLYNKDEIKMYELTIPHPHFQNREFVMIPLLEIIQETDEFHSFIHV
jgi:2-amino-4-hydroxy-6-hydroxymethyldihydropteridine diphosphokinase